MSDVKTGFLPCPFCGSIFISIDNISDEPSGINWRAICHDCGCVPEGECQSEEASITQWNTRPDNSLLEECFQAIEFCRHSKDPCIRSEVKDVFPKLCKRLNLDIEIEEY